MSKTLKFIFVIIGVAALLAIGCGGNEGKKESKDNIKLNEHGNADKLVEEGKQLLSQGVPLKAREKFLKALEVEPDHPLALYGVPIADSMHTFEVLNIVIMYINMALDPGFDKAKPIGSLDDLIDAALQGLATDIADEAVDYVQTCLEKNATEFMMDLPIPIIIDFKHECDVQGRFGEEELYAIWAFNLTVAGLMRHALAVDLDFDMGLAQQIADIDFSDWLAALGEIVDILLAIMNDPGHPNFLGIEPGEIPTYQRAGQDLGLGLLKFSEAVSAITQKPADNSNDIFGYIDMNNNGQWDQGEPLRIPCMGVLDEAQTSWLYAILDVTTDLGYSFIDYSEYDPDPATPNPFDLSTLNRILELLGIPPILPSIKIDFGIMYVNPDPNELRNKIIDLLEFLDQILP